MRRFWAATAHTAGSSENSLPAFAAAAKNGYGIELDVQFTADRRLVVFHDDTLDRMTPAKGFVHDMPWAEFSAQPLAEVNLRRLERELVLAYETGAAVTVVLTKADLAESEEQVEQVADRVRTLAGPDVRTLVVSDGNTESVEAVRALMAPGTTTVLVGKSGVGKSSLVNMLVGEEVQETGTVREGDGKGRHTTVSREMVAIPGGGYVVDMPGVRGLGLWDADAGIGAAFADIEQAAQQCRFRDCKHENEPGCAVRAAVQSGEIAPERFASYQALKQETATLRDRREEARRMRGEKASDKKRGGQGGRPGRGKRRR